MRTCREANIRVVPLPGPCAAIAALSAAGLPSDRFCYEGFLPAKSKGRRDTLKALEEEPRTLIFYESTHRLVESLEDICAVLGESRYVVLARELTKTWESIHGAPIGELVAWVKEDENRRKGEMVLIVEGFKAQEEALPAAALRTLALLQAELPLKKAAALAAEIHGVKKTRCISTPWSSRGSDPVNPIEAWQAALQIVKSCLSVLPHVGRNVGKNVGRKGQNRFSCRPASLTNKPG